MSTEPQPQPTPSLKAVRLPDFSDEGELPIDADPPGRRRAPQPLSATLGALLRRLHLPDDAWMQELLDAWPALVGAEVAACARPGKLEKGIFYIYVRNSTALFELRRYKLKPLEDALRRHLGAQRVRQVRLSVDPEADGGAISAV